MKILLLRKSNCPYCDKALEFLRNTNHTIGVLQSDKRFDKFPNDIGWKPDVVFSFKNYMILPKKITDNTLCINFHPGPPEHPGSCSANWALYNQDSEFGVTAHFMNDIVDNGLIFRVRRFPINLEDSLDDLLDKANIEYWATDGTLLGIVRSKGFIPWDDDVDIAIDIKDKSKLRKISIKKVEKDFISMSSMKQWILEEDIGKMCSFLISDESSRVSGQVISVDGHTERND